MNRKEKNVYKEKTDRIKERKETTKSRGYRGLLAAWSFLTLLFGCGCPVLASANYGQSTANWFLEQVFWIALVIVILAVLALAAKRNFTAALTTAVVGAIVVFFIKNPTKLEDIGNAIMNAIGI